MSDDDTKKHARAAEIASAIKKHDDDKEYHGQMLDKMLTGLDAIADAVGKLGTRLDDLETKHLPAPGGAKRRGATVLKGDEDLNRLPGEPKAVVADSADPNEALYGHGNRKHDGAFLQCQADADRVAVAWGARSTPPMQSEQLLDYRRRLLRPWMRYSSQFKGIDVDEVSEPMLTPVEKSVLADAWAAACSNASAPPDMLREVITVDNAGRRISTFYGQPKVWIQQFAGNRRKVLSFRTNFDR
jgi:hypothetical protein